MDYASRWLKRVVVTFTAVAAVVLLSGGISPCFAQQQMGASTADQGYASGPGGYAQPGTPSSGAQSGFAGGSDQGLSVPVPGGGQVNVPEPGAQAPGNNAGSRGGVWSLKQTNPNSGGGLPVTGP